MGEEIAAVVPFAVGVAVSPVPIVAVILMLFSARARVNGPMYLLGWAGGLTIVFGIASLAGAAASEGSSAPAWVQVALGVLLLLFAVRQWRSRPAPGEAPVLPKWMAGIDAMKPGRALIIGAALSSVNPKNLLLTLGAVAAVAAVSTSTGIPTAALVVFVIVASLSIGIPVGYYLLGGESAKAHLDDLKGWLTAHNSAVMAVLFLVFGVNLLSAGIGALV